MLTLMKCASFKSQWQPLTGHSDLSVSKHLHAFRLSHPKLAFNLVHQTKGPLGHAQHWPPYTHPPSYPKDCICSSFTRKDRSSSLLFLLSFFHSYPSQQFCFFHFLPASELNILKKPAISPRASVLGCWASACHDHTQSYCNCINWHHLPRKWFICVQYWWKMVVQIVQYSNR